MSDFEISKQDETVKTFESGEWSFDFTWNIPTEKVNKIITALNTSRLKTTFYNASWLLSLVHNKEQINNLALEMHCREKIVIRDLKANLKLMQYRDFFSDDEFSYNRHYEDDYYDDNPYEDLVVEKFAKTIPVNLKHPNSWVADAVISVQTMRDNGAFNEEYGYSQYLVVHVQFTTTALDPPAPVAIQKEVKSPVELGSPAPTVSDQPSDVVFVVGGQRFAASRSLLSARSEYFKAELANEAIKELTIDDIEPDVFDIVLQYLNTSQLPNSDWSEQALDVLITAVRFTVNDLVDLTEAYLRDHVTFNNYFEVMHVANTLSLPRLKSHVLRYVKDSYTIVTKLDNDWKEFEKQFPKEVIAVQEQIINEKMAASVKRKKQ